MIAPLVLCHYKDDACVVRQFDVLSAGWVATEQLSLAAALILMIVSMAISLRKLQISVGALDLLLAELENEKKKSG